MSYAILFDATTAAERLDLIPGLPCQVSQPLQQPAGSLQRQRLAWVVGKFPVEGCFASFRGWVVKGEEPRPVVGALALMVVRRCPTLPHPPGCSTIGAVGLSFRVRNGTGRFPHAMTAVTLLPVPAPFLVGVGGKTLWLQLWCCYLVVGSGNPWCGLLFGNHIVDACSVLCGVSCWPISTGQLHESLVLASTSGLSTQWSGWGPLTHKCVWKSHLEASFPLRCFQRLSHPNVANQRCTWQYN